MSGSFEVRPETVPPEAGMLLDPEGHGAHYRDLAKNLRALDGPPSSVAVTGASEGVGSSSVCLGLGGALASMNLSAAVVDYDLESPELHRMLGEPNFTGLSAARDGEGRTEDHGYEPAPGLLVVPTGPILEEPFMDREGLCRAIEGLGESRDVVLLDAPGEQVLGTPALSRSLDGVLLVVHASRTAKSEARQAARALEEAGTKLLGVVLNG